MQPHNAERSPGWSPAADQEQTVVVGTEVDTHGTSLLDRLDATSTTWNKTFHLLAHISVPHAASVSPSLPGPSDDR